MTREYRVHGMVKCLTCLGRMMLVVPLKTSADEHRVFGVKTHAFTVCSHCTHLMAIDIQTGRLRDLTRPEAEQFKADAGVWPRYSAFVEKLHKEKGLWG